MSPFVPTFRIISICDDRALRESRESVLKREHFEVHSFSSSDRPGISLIRETSLVIICSSIDSATACGLRQVLHRDNPEIRFLDLSLMSQQGSRALLFDARRFLNIVKMVARSSNENRGMLARISPTHLLRSS